MLNYLNEFQSIKKLALMTSITDRRCEALISSAIILSFVFTLGLNTNQIKTVFQD